MESQKWKTYSEGLAVLLVVDANDGTRGSGGELDDAGLRDDLSAVGLILKNINKKKNKKK